jgi:lipid II:glycine glycyltransferase (peptidoglycan interpeptide bridge formation enzyme)
MLARHRGKIIAGTLYLHDDTNVYSYLGGADQEYQNLRPSNAVVFGMVHWAHALRKRRLILGGGYRPDDGIFRFKSSFSPLRAPFKVYRKVHLSAAYQTLVAAWSAEADSDPTTYFPAYRAPYPNQETAESPET